MEANGKVAEFFMIWDEGENLKGGGWIMGDADRDPDQEAISMFLSVIMRMPIWEDAQLLGAYSRSRWRIAFTNH